MNQFLRLASAAIVVVALASLAAPAAEMKKNITIDRASFDRLKSLFGAYPPSTEYVLFGGEDLRMRLPDGVDGIPQSGAYSLFALTGDCEVTVAYELLKLQPPRSGYGSGFGLAFDAGDQVGWAEIKRVDKVPEGNGYVLQTSLAKSGKEMKGEYKFVPADTERGRIGLRRINKDLVFLAADEVDDELKEIARLPFTDRTIQKVRLFVDAGGSPTAVDVRVLEIVVRSEEVAGGKPKKIVGASSRWWLWIVVPAAGSVVVLGLWWVRRRSSADG